MLINIVLFFIGIYLTISVFFLIVWIGRRQDKNNLSFSLLALTFAMFQVLYVINRYLKNDMLQLSSYILLSSLLCCVVPFFAHTIGLVTRRMERWVVRFSIACVMLGVSVQIASLIVKSPELYRIFYAPVNSLLILAINVACTISYVREKRFADLDGKGKRVAVLFCVFSVVIFAGFAVENLPGIALHKEYRLVFVHSSFIVMMFAFAYELVSGFNREHRDLVELKTNLERKVEERTAELELVHDQKTQFFVNLAHETKTPLTLVRNYLEEYMKGRSKDRELSIIRDCFAKLELDMLNFLDYERLDKGKIVYDHERITNVSSIAGRQTLLFGEYAARKNIELESDIEERVLTRIDPSALERIINNLVENAIKYTDRNGKVTVTVRNAGGRCILGIADNGPGIAEEEQTRIFEPYYQISTRKRNLQGIGMGLGIVRKIAEQAGGRILVSSAIGSGTTFSVEFASIDGQEAADIACDREDALPIHLFEEPEPVPEQFVEGRPVVLLVDDNREMLAFIAKKLSPLYNVCCAAGGNEALSLMERRKPDIVVSDVMMHPMDGYAFLDRVTGDERYSSVPFIFLTALATTDDRIRGISKGAVDYIEKPFHMDELTAKIKSILAVRSALARESLGRLGERVYNHLKALHEDGGSVPVSASDVSKALYEGFRITRRQIEIIALLRLGLERKEISDRLCISVNTVKTQMRRIFEKCGIGNKTELLNLFPAD